IANSAVEGATGAAAGRSEDQAFLDEYAMSLTGFDEHDKLYLGSPYLALVTLPVPRQLWPEKPGLADHLRDISTPRRPLSEVGAIITYIGEAYGNFGILGVLLVPGVVAYALGRAFRGAYRRPYDSIERFAYLMLACNLLQVYRDGLTSIVVFTAVNMM